MRRLVVLGLGLVIGLGAAPRSAAAECTLNGNEFAVLVGASSGLVMSLASAVTIAATDPGANAAGAAFGAGLVTGGLVLPLTAYAVSQQLDSSCGGSESVFVVQASVGAGGALVGSLAAYFLLRHSSVAVGYVPRPEGSGLLTLSGRF